MIPELARVLGVEEDLLRRVSTGSIGALVLDDDEAAALLRVSRATIREALAEGQLPGAKIGRAMRFYLPALLEHLRGGYHHPPRL